jgi:hypothetical protein
MKYIKTNCGIYWMNFKGYLHGIKVNWDGVLWESIPKDYLLAE